MKQLLLLLLLALSYTTIDAQDEIYGLNDFNDLSVSANIKMELIPSNENKMEIDITKGDRSDLKIEENGDNLSVYIEGKNKWSNNKTKAKIKLYFKELEDISVSAGASVFTDATIKSNEFDADVSSVASLSINLETGSLDSNVSSGGSLKIEGRSNMLEVDASSGGSFQGGNFKSKNAEVGASSGGSINLWVSDSIEAETSSGGSIKYKGNPSKRDIDKDKWSGGSIISMGNN